MDGPRWRWSLSNGGRVEAEIFSAAGLECVTIGGRAVSKCQRGGKPDGHVIDVPPREEGETLQATLTFDPRNAICILRVAGEEIAPTEWPKAQPKKIEAAPSGVAMRWPLVAVALVVLVVVIAIVAWRGPSKESLEGQTATYRAPSGLFVAHLPSTMKLSPIALPPPFAGVIVTAPDASAIVVAAAKLDGAMPADVWLLQKQWVPETFPHLPRGGGKLEETERRDDTCLGERGAVVIGVLTSSDGRRSKLWSCTLIRAEAAYVVLSVHPEPVTSADERRLRAIVDATELTRLAELTTPP